MPTTYAHDLFGKRVYRKLSAKLQHLIRSNGNLYRIGQHGPDILFYYFISKNPVTQYGVQMHGRKAREFFEKGMAKVREEKNPALMAYLLGPFRRPAQPRRTARRHRQPRNFTSWLFLPIITSKSPDSHTKSRL